MLTLYDDVILQLGLTNKEKSLRDKFVNNAYIYIYIQRITMSPHGYHHNGFMATPALGTQEVRLHIVWIAL